MKPENFGILASKRDGHKMPRLVLRGLSSEAAERHSILLSRAYPGRVYEVVADATPQTNQEEIKQ